MRTVTDIVPERLRNQWLVGAPRGTTAPDVVRWMGAVQAQDYGAAKWAVAQRAGDLTSTDLDQALAEGSILRTHVLRPTWHFVVPTDIRWMLRLTAPRVKALTAFGNRESGLDESTFARSNRAIAAALQGGRQLSRFELGDVLRRAGVSFPDTIGLGRLIMRAELDGIVCSGALRGKQHTYALLDDRVPLAEEMDRDAMLAALASRYFASHGPATIKDFAWWSGLSVADGTAAVQLAGPGLEQSVVDGRTYWSAPPALRRPRPTATTAHLLPNYDEYTVAYADRNPIRAADHIRRFDSRGDTIFNNVVLVDGRVAGTWKRTVQKTAVHLAVTPFRSLTEDESAAVVAAAQRYGRFLELRAEVSMVRSAR
jgi:Winged helix DNA-binding domain